MYYSQSQGKFVEDDSTYQPLGSQATGGSFYAAPPSAGISSSSQGKYNFEDPEWVKQSKQNLLNNMYLDPKNYTYYKGILDSLDKYGATGEKEKVELKGTPYKDVKFARNVISSAQSAAKEYKASYSGPIDSATKNLALALNMAPEGYASYKQYIGDVRTSIRNYISGVAVSEAEAKELENLIPGLTDSDQKVQEKLAGIQRIFISKTQDALDTAGYTNINAEDYLKTQVVEPSREGTASPLKAAKGALNALVGPYVRTAQNVGTAAVTVPQAQLAQAVGVVSPQAGAKIASADILGTQKRAGEVANKPVEYGVQQALDSGLIALEALGVKYAGPKVSGLTRAGSKLSKESMAKVIQYAVKKASQSGLKGNAKRLLINYLVAKGVEKATGIDIPVI